MALLVFFMWNRPLGPSLGLPTYTPGISANVAGAPTSIGQVALTTPELSSTQPVPTTGAIMPSPTPMRQPLCGGPKTMTILGIGSDERNSGYLYGLGDSIHVMRIDFTVPNIMVIDFPRDLWVEIPGISDHYGITHGKLNQSYLFGNPGMGYYDGPGEGPGLMARTLDVNFGLRVDHYLAVDAQTFRNIIDAIGGIDIELDAPIDFNVGHATPDPKLYFEAGTHHLNGKQAYTFATSRIPSTFARMQYQKIVMSAIRQKLFSPEVLPKIPIFIAQFISSVQTDFSPSDINSLICIAQAVPKENIKVDSFPQDMFTASEMYDPYRHVYTFVYLADFNQLRAMVAEFMNGIWPMPK